MFCKWKSFYRPSIVLILLQCISCIVSGYDKKAPHNLIIPPESETETTITLLWNKPEKYAEVKRYAIFEDGRYIAASTKTNFTVTDLKPDVTYHFFIRAIDYQGGLSASSNSVEVRTKKESKIFNIIDYGAKGDGITKNTIAIQKAINACTPGGTVLIPKGTFLSGALFLKSDLTFYIAAGGMLKGTVNPEDYLPMIKNRFEGWEEMSYASLINAGTLNSKGGYSVHNISIIGKGTIRGGGATLGNAMIEKNGDRSRGRLILLMNSLNINIQGLTIEEPPCWTIHYIYSKNITCHDLFIKSTARNGDGLDPDSSTDSYIFNCTFSTGDDCIAIKSGKNPEGYYIGRPTKNVQITNCNFVKGHGISIGSEISGGISNILVRDCKAGDLKYGFQIKGTKDRGGYVKDVVVKDCSLRKITIFSSVGYNNDGEPAPVLPYYKNIQFSKINMIGATENPLIIIQGFDKKSHYDKHLVFKNISIPNNSLIQMDHCNNVLFKNVISPNGTPPRLKKFKCGNVIFQQD